MKGFSELAKLSIFSVADVEALTGNVHTARSMLARLMDKGYVQKIRNNMYSTVNPSTDSIVASKYQIACAINNFAYLTHHTAFEFYGLANQVYYEVYVASKPRFKDFDFEGITYRRVAPRINLGVVEPRTTQGVRVTDLERTVIDSIKDFEKIGGFEELMNCLSLVNDLDEVKLRAYLDAYRVQALYQRAGYLLDYFREEMRLSQEFIEYCKNRVGKSTAYLLEEAKHRGVYVKEWQLIVPEGLIAGEHGGDPLV
ncbi:MAG: transcriptional regulator [Firmicutes bacterium]|nr:transcriptional regulator [Bacillota bacterium]